MSLRTSPNTQSRLEISIALSIVPLLCSFPQRLSLSHLSPPPSLTLINPAPSFTSSLILCSLLFVIFTSPKLLPWHFHGPSFSFCLAHSAYTFCIDRAPSCCLHVEYRWMLKHQALHFQMKSKTFCIKGIQSTGKLCVKPNVLRVWSKTIKKYF